VAKCVVIGGNGFLGSYIVDELAARGHTVTVFDRFSAAAQTGSGAANYAASGVRQIVGDFLDTDSVKNALVGQEYVFHFLSTTTPASADNDPSLDVRTNVSQSVKLFELALDAGVECVYFASTGGAMYGDVAGESIDETVAPAPVSPYAIGKLAIEGYLRFFERSAGLRSVSFRISNPYGPRQHSGKKQGVIPIFLHRIFRGEPVTVLGDGSMIRDYIYAADAARLIVETVGRDTRHAIYNIGSGEGTTINDVVSLTREITATTVDVEWREQPATFVDRVVLDMSRYEAEFGAVTLKPIREGIRLTWLDTVGQES
jgi:UDP-glucose 4-epimerase